jgi:plastocyanin
MKKLIISFIAAALLTPACAGGAATESVLVDYKHDEFASAFFNFYPNHVQVHPGDTLVFRQAWSGEPHSVTMGTVVDEYGRLVKPYLKIFAKKGYEGLPDETPPKIDKIERKLPWMVDDNGKAAQNGAQPCFLAKGLPPKSTKKPCTKAQQHQPEFTGRYSYFNSGFIPYAGPNGDTYTLKVADSAKPGEHFFYCNYHGPFMSGFLTIEPSPNQYPRKTQSRPKRTKRSTLSPGSSCACSAMRPEECSNHPRTSFPISRSWG